MSTAAVCKEGVTNHGPGHSRCHEMVLGSASRWRGDMGSIPRLHSRRERYVPLHSWQDDIDRHQTQNSLVTRTTLLYHSASLPRREFRLSTTSSI